MLLHLTDRFQPSEVLRFSPNQDVQTKINDKPSNSVIANPTMLDDETDSANRMYFSQNKKYRCVIGKVTAASQVSNWPSARTL